MHKRFFLSLLTVITVMLSSCTRTLYVPVEKTLTRTDTVFSAKSRVDSVFFRDSVTVLQRGDTVLLTRYRDRYRVKERIDTLYQSVNDSVKIRVPYPVERELTRWERMKMDFGGMAIGGLVVAAIAVVWLVFIKRRR